MADINIKYNEETFLIITDEEQLDLCHKLQSTDIESWIKHVINHFPSRKVKLLKNKLIDEQTMEDQELERSERVRRPFPVESNAPSGIELKYNGEVIYAPTMTVKNILNEFLTDDEIEEKFKSEITKVISEKISICQKALEELVFEEDPETGNRRIPNPPADKRERRELVRSQDWYKNRDQREDVQTSGRDVPPP